MVHVAYPAALDQGSKNLVPYSTRNFLVICVSHCETCASILTSKRDLINISNIPMIHNFIVCLSPLFPQIYSFSKLQGPTQMHHFSIRNLLICLISSLSLNLLHFCYILWKYREARATTGVKVKVDLYSSMFSVLSSTLSLVFQSKSTKVCFLSILSMDLSMV